MNKLGLVTTLGVAVVSAFAIGTSMSSALSAAQINPPQGVTIQQSFKAEIEDAIVQETGKNYFRISVVGAVWNVNVDSKTTIIIRRYGGPSTIGEIKVGDIMDIRGSVVSGNDINATVVYNFSSLVKRGTFAGKLVIQEKPGTLILDIGQGSLVTAAVDSETRYYKFPGKEDAKFDDIHLGNRVIITGLWDDSTGVVREITRVIFESPATPTK
ncbi:MAG: hypothetical protein EXR59_03405 [Dehalococcoidia bacterium]|nr:hypothetical protein [Dehalococcoidia bacterium]